MASGILHSLKQRSLALIATTDVSISAYPVASLMHVSATAIRQMIIATNGLNLGGPCLSIVATLFRTHEASPGKHMSRRSVAVWASAGLKLCRIQKDPHPHVHRPLLCFVNDCSHFVRLQVPLLIVVLMAPQRAGLSFMAYRRAASSQQRLGNQ